jgi:hypothetical protein
MGIGVEVTHRLKIDFCIKKGRTPIGAHPAKRRAEIIGFYQDGKPGAGSKGWGVKGREQRPKGTGQRGLLPLNQLRKKGMAGSKMHHWGYGSFLQRRKEKMKAAKELVFPCVLSLRLCS